MKTSSLNLIVLTIFILMYAQIHSQAKRILIYHETEGYRHASIDDGIKMFEDLGNENNIWATDVSQNSNVFNTSNLSQYDAVVFLSVNGNDILSNTEKTALENFIASGNGFVGIHASSDAFNDNSWPFYTELLGAIVQEDPYHTSSNYTADVEVVSDNSIIDFLGNVGADWEHTDEFYYWEGGYLSSDNTVLLKVESTGSNSYDAKRPITWFKESITYDDDNNSETPDVTLSGIRSFYTGLGHHEVDYLSNSDFRTLLKNATLWAIGDQTLNIENSSSASLKLINNPVKDKIEISLNNSGANYEIDIYDVSGKQLISETVNQKGIINNKLTFDVSHLKTGMYFVVANSENESKTFKVFKN